MNERDRRLANADDPLILLTKMEEIMQYTHIALRQFPKAERFLLCAEIKNCVDEVVHHVIRMKKKYYKKTTLQDIDIELEYLRILIRSAAAYEYINNQRRHVWIGHIDEAGRILGGLIKHYANVPQEKQGK